MIAVDTSILIYAHRSDLPFHVAARGVLESLSTGRSRWAVPWPCIHEFLAVVTHARVFRTPSPPGLALSVIEALQQSGRCEFLAEGDVHLRTLAELAVTANVTGGQIHDARIAAICSAHGVRELWSADRDFSRYPALRVVNPLISAALRYPPPSS